MSPRGQGYGIFQHLCYHHHVSPWRILKVMKVGFPPSQFWPNQTREQFFKSPKTCLLVNSKENSYASPLFHKAELCGLSGHWLYCQQLQPSELWISPAFSELPLTFWLLLCLHSQNHVTEFWPPLNSHGWVIFFKFINKNLMQNAHQLI